MGDLLRIALDSIEYLWPFVIVHQWQRGLLYIFGRYICNLPPFVYPRIPFFTTIACIDTVPDSQMTATQTVTVRNGDTVTFAIVHELEVIDAALANNVVMAHENKAHLDTLSAVAETLSTVDDARLDPEKRKSLLRTCILNVNKRLATYGMRCNEIEFPVFVRNMRNYRLFGSPNL